MTVEWARCKQSVVPVATSCSNYSSPLWKACSVPAAHSVVSSYPQIEEVGSCILQMRKLKFPS